MLDRIELMDAQKYLGIYRDGGINFKYSATEKIIEGKIKKGAVVPNTL